jgi:two-component system cell cycle sensor histidine kinase/response regulator CckA
MAQSDAEKLQFQASLLEVVGHPMVVVDPSRTIIYWNKAAEAKYGWTAEEAIGRTSTELITRNETPTQLQDIVETLLRGDSWSGDFEVKRRDGVVVPVYVTNSPVFDAKGRLTAIIGVSADASERRRLSAIVDGSGDAIIGVDRAGLINTWNGAAERLFGYGAEEIIGQPATILAPADKQDEQLAASMRVIENRSAEHLETTRVRKDGSTFDMSLTLSPTMDESGVVTGMSAIAHDVTEQRAAQRALELSQRQLADAQRIAQVGSVEVDLERGTITRSAEFSRLLGLSDEQQTSAELFVSVLDADDAPSWREAWVAAVERGEPFDLRYRITRSDGERRWMHVRGAPERGADGAVVRIVGTLVDETDRIEAEEVRHGLEERLRQSQRLESLGQLAGGIAHDFNNLLNVILNYAKFVAEVTDGQVHDDADEIITAAEAAGRLTRQLLTFARREQVSLQALDLNAVVDDVHGLLARSIGEHVHLVVRSAELPLISADRGHMEQILLNLAVNARDAMPDGGTLTIETAVVTFDDADLTLPLGAKPGTYVQLTVTDTGTGMSPEVAAHAFEPFFTTKAKESGTGLGLATVHGIVTGSGGSVHVASKEGVGTTVRVYLPSVADGEGPEGSIDATEHVRGSGERILVVEDHPAVRALTVRMLRRNGYVAAEAHSASDGALMASATPFDLLLTDVVMPDMSGRALAELIAATNPTQRVLYMSGYSDGVLGPSRGLDPGVALIEKPFSELALLEAVHAALRD